MTRVLAYGAAPRQSPAEGPGDAGRLHIEALDGLRGIAALSVMGYHAWVFNAAGWLAVDFFYCLSGFVIALAYERRLAGGLAVPRYMAWRLLRVYPMLLVGAVIGVITWRSNENAAAIAESTTPFAAIWLAHVLLVPFIGQHKAFPFNNVQWSVVYELIANALHAALLPFLGTRVLAGLVLACGTVLAQRTFTIGTMNWGFDLRHIDVGLARMGYSFFCGVLLFRLKDRILPRLPRLPFALLALAFLTIASVHGLEWVHPWLEPLRQVATVVVVHPVLIALGVVCGGGGRAVRWLGALSFPLYAIHLPLVFHARILLEPVLAGAALKAAVAGICLLIAGAALLLGLYVDLPLNRLRRRLLR